MRSHVYGDEGDSKVRGDDNNKLYDWRSTRRPESKGAFLYLTQPRTAVKVEPNRIHIELNANQSKKRCVAAPASSLHA